MAVLHPDHLMWPDLGRQAWYGPIHHDSWGPEDPPWVPRDAEHWNFTDLAKCGLMEMGLSRRLMNRLHDLSVQGVAGYLEVGCHAQHLLKQCAILVATSSAVFLVASCLKARQQPPLAFSIACWPTRK